MTSHQHFGQIWIPVIQRVQNTKMLFDRTLRTPTQGAEAVAVEPEQMVEIASELPCQLSVTTTCDDAVVEIKITFGLIVIESAFISDLFAVTHQQIAQRCQLVVGHRRSSQSARHALQGLPDQIELVQLLSRERYH